MLNGIDHLQVSKMKIRNIIWQNRRDFSAIMICEGCGYEKEIKHGYDDRNYHDNVIPAAKCPNCGKSRNDLGIVAEKTPTKYEPWEDV